MSHKDYHNWDAREDEAYHRWLETKHQAYVDYDRLEHKRQEECWKWRHNHEEHEEHEHHSNDCMDVCGEVSASAAILSYNRAHACRIWGNDEGRRHGA